MMLTAKRSRLLATWILTAALVSALAALPAAFAGEPDMPGSTLPPTQTQTTGDATLPWAMRLQAALQVLLMYLPQTLP